MAGSMLIPAASVIVLRPAEGVAPFEVLLLRRNANSSFVPNAWVFPGGTANANEEMRETAARETLEEAGLALDPAQLVATSRWITPVGIPKRFDTWFFLAKVARDATIQIDGREIVDSMWIPPAHALSRRDLHLVFPTIKNLEAIAQFDSADALIESRRGAVIEPIQPVLVDGKPTLK